MDFFEVVEKRRSVRRYTSKKVPDEVIEKALSAALMAPNSSNLQPWEFYWVKSPDKKSKLIDACLFQGTAKTASHLVVAVSRIDTWKRNRDLFFKNLEKDGPASDELKSYYYKIIPFLYKQDPLGFFSLIRWVGLAVAGLFRPIVRRPRFKSELFEVVTKTTALACENFMLAITAQGYGSCPMEGFDEKHVKKILGLGSKAHVVMIISVGDIAADGIFGPQFRVDSNFIVHKV